MNEALEQDKVENKDSETDSERESIHSNWSDFVPMERNELSKVEVSKKRTVRNIVLVPYKPKPKNWGSWRAKSPYATSIVASPNFDSSDQIQENFNNQIQEDNQEDKLTYIPHSPYHEPVCSPQYYENV